MLQLVAQMQPLFLVFDTLRNTDMRFLRQINQQTPGEADLRRQPRTLGTDRILDHLHHDVLTLGQQTLDRFGFDAFLALPPEIGNVQKRRPRPADINERRLHARQHAHHAPHINVADPAARRGALDLHLLHNALLYDSDPRFLRRDVDQNFFAHGALSGFSPG